MKKIIILLALLAGFTATYAQEFNPVVNSGDVHLRTCVIKPLQIENIQCQNPQQIPTVIKGQVRTLGIQDQYYLTFRLTKEMGRNVRFTLNFADLPVEGVTLKGSWLFTPGLGYWDPVTAKPIVEQSGPWTWIDLSPVGVVCLQIKKIDASQATATGLITFTATMTGTYSDL